MKQVFSKRCKKWAFPGKNASFSPPPELLISDLGLFHNLLPRSVPVSFFFSDFQFLFSFFLSFFLSFFSLFLLLSFFSLFLLLSWSFCVCFFVRLFCYLFSWEQKKNKNKTVKMFPDLGLSISLNPEQQSGKAASAKENEAKFSTRTHKESQDGQTAQRQMWREELQTNLLITKIMTTSATDATTQRPIWRQKSLGNQKHQKHQTGRTHKNKKRTKNRIYRKQKWTQERFITGFNTRRVGGTRLLAQMMFPAFFLLGQSAWTDQNQWWVQKCVDQHFRI